MPADVELNGSFKVKVTCVPEKVTVDTAGGVTSGCPFELLVTVVLDNDAASFPDKSCAAELLVKPLAVGAVYETDTDSPETIFVPTVNMTVEPLIDTAVGLNVMPFKVME